jgi:hypothetical protein
MYGRTEKPVKSDTYKPELLKINKEVDVFINQIPLNLLFHVSGLVKKCSNSCMMRKKTEDHHATSRSTTIT